MKKILLVILVAMAASVANAKITLMYVDGDTISYAASIVKRIDFNSQTGSVVLVRKSGENTATTVLQLDRIVFATTIPPSKPDTTESAVSNIYADNVGITVYPNPTSDVIYIDNVAEHTPIRVYDLNGALLIKAVADRQTSLAVDQLPNGTYILQVGEHNVKFIKD